MTTATLPPSVAAAYAAVTTHRSTVAVAELDGQALAQLLPRLLIGGSEMKQAAYAARNARQLAGEVHDVTIFRRAFERGYNLTAPT